MNTRKKYIKKPLIIEAFIWTGQPVANYTIRYKDEKPYQLLVATLEGIMSAEIGDYIIIGIKGELYPCKPDIFKASYDECLDGTSVTTI